MARNYKKETEYNRIKFYCIRIAMPREMEEDIKAACKEQGHLASSYCKERLNELVHEYRASKGLVSN